MKKLVHIIVSFGVLLLAWQLAVSVGNYNEALFPGPVKVVNGFVELIQNGVLLEDIKDSLTRFAIGYLAAILMGGVLGLLLGLHQNIWKFVNPVVQFIRPISPIAWLPFIVLWFGIGDIPAVVIIFIAGFFPILISTVTAVKRVDPVYIKVANNFGLSKIECLLKIIVPSVIPNIMTGIHLALGTAWVFLVAGEMVGAQSGLGYLIIDARNNLRMDLLLSSMVTIGAIGIILDFIIGLIEKRLIRIF